jgi:hypothetical protein
MTRTPLYLLLHTNTHVSLSILEARPSLAHTLSPLFTRFLPRKRKDTNPGPEGQVESRGGGERKGKSGSRLATRECPLLLQSNRCRLGPSGEIRSACPAAAEVSSERPPSAADPRRGSAPAHARFATRFRARDSPPPAVRACGLGRGRAVAVGLRWRITAPRGVPLVLVSGSYLGGAGLRLRCCFLGTVF